MDDARINVLEALISYVDFSAEDAALLVEMGPILSPSFPRIVDRFYDVIQRTPEANAVFTGGDAQITRQKGMLLHWLEGLVGGIYDVEYYEKRARIGRTHVRIDLDQRFMFAAMNLIRRELHAALTDSDWPEDTRWRGHTALDKICDIELAVMLETYREDSDTKLTQASRLATFGQVAASIGHELRNPLAVMQTSLQLLGRRIASDDERAQRHLKKLGGQVGLCNAIISDLLELARDREPERHAVDVVDLVRNALDEFHRPEGVQIDLRVSAPMIAAELDAVQIRQVVLNLVLNASQASGPSGEVEVVIAGDDEVVTLTVEDNGPGLPTDVERRLFEPLFTTRSSGTGLGLALCRRIIDKHSGTITATNRPQGGARFVVTLPRTRPIPE